MGFLNREALLKKSVLKIEKVDLGGGDHVFVKELTAGERDDYELSLVDNSDNGESRKNLKDFRAKFCVRTVCDEKGNRILGESDIEAFSNSISSSKMKRIFEAAKKLNNIAEDQVSEQEKN